jgi:hypothetical protein
VKRLILVLALIVACFPVHVQAQSGYFVGIWACDLNNINGQVECRGFAGARAWICLKGECAWYTTGADGMAGVWVDWGTPFSVSPAPPIGYRQCKPWRVMPLSGVVGAGPIVGDVVWTGYCSMGDIDPCPIWGCGPGLKEVSEWGGEK